MKRILLLKSSGRDVDSYKPLLHYLKKPLNEIKICFITTASHPETNKDYLRKDISAMHKVGFKKIQEYDIKDKNEETLRKELSNFDIIFVSGGNSFYLLKYIRESGFEKVIKSLLNKGVIYIGASAGSIVTCQTIEMSLWKNQDKNIVELKDLTGMNLVPFLTFVHFNPEWKQVVKENSEKNHISIVALTDQQAVLCVDGKYKIIGEGERITFNDFQETL